MSEIATYDALWRVPDFLMDQAHHAHIYRTGEYWVIETHSESERVLFLADGFPDEKYARKHCGHADIPVHPIDSIRPLPASPGKGADTPHILPDPEGEPAPSSPATERARVETRATS